MPPHPVHAMSDLGELVFRWVAGREMADDTLRECSALFSEHYGVYDQACPPESGKSPGARVRMSATRMRQLLDPEGAWAALAYLGGKLVGYAFVVRDSVPGAGTISWVTQLVVHTDYQNRGIASRLLHAAWGLSDQFGWGLVTANPYAVRALENATRRRCEPPVIGQNVKVLGDFADRFVNYMRGAAVAVDVDRSVVDTRFFVSHAELGDRMSKVSSTDKPWKLGPLGPGQEWLAFVFREQPPGRLTVDEFERLVRDHDGIVREAYARMRLDDSHKWAGRTAAEVDFAVDNLRLDTGARVLDVGCGLGRHALELARRGYSVVGVDFVGRFIEAATLAAQEHGLAGRVRFAQRDARTLELGEQFDAVLCLYDVIGSFPDDVDNERIVSGLGRHLKPGGRALISVLNRGLVEATATHRGAIRDHLDEFLGLPPSGTMERTGEIFDPAHLFFDPTTSLVYRKEQFTHGGLPCELVVRDRRYGKEELEAICRQSGIEPVWSRHVRMGHWDDDYPPGDNHAKEVLLLGVKR